MQGNMRRKDRAADEERTLKVLRGGEYGVLSTVSPEGQPYGVPLHYCLLDNAVYFHCASEGHKLANLAANNRASFCVVGETRVLAQELATAYESVVVFGPVTEAHDDEKMKAYQAIAAKYSGDFPEESAAYIEKFGARARVFRLDIQTITGKARNA